MLLVKMEGSILM
jgi:hypothetical protein